MAGARTRPPPARCLHRSVPSSTPGRIMTHARHHLSKPPSRLPPCFRTYLDAAKKSIATFLVLLRHTLSAYGTAPSPATELTTNYIGTPTCRESRCRYVQYHVVPPPH